MEWELRALHTVWMQGGPEHSQYPASHSAGGLPGLSVSLIPTSFLLPPVPTGTTNPEPSRAPQSGSCPLHFLLLSLSLQSPAQPSAASDLYQSVYNWLLTGQVLSLSFFLLLTPHCVYPPLNSSWEKMVMVEENHMEPMDSQIFSEFHHSIILLLKKQQWGQEKVLVCVFV